MSANQNRSGVAIAGAVLLIAGVGAAWWSLQDDPSPAPQVPPAAPTAPDAGPALPPAATETQQATTPPAAAAEPAAAGPKDPVREIPRKKLPLVKLDLDGDGKAETLRLSQKQPAKDWAGKDKQKGPRFTLEVLGADNTVLATRERYGWGQGWAQVGVRIGGGAHVAMLFWSVPEAQETRASYVWLTEGKVAFGEFKRVPLDLIDLRFAGIEALTVFSQELYQDFVKRGTMQLVTWRGGGFEPVLEQPVFEVCVAAVNEPHVQLAVVEKDQRTLKLLHIPPASEQPLMEVDSVPVTPATEGPKYTVPTGFALSCDRSKKQIQYKSQRYSVAAGQLRPIE